MLDEVDPVLNPPDGHGSTDGGNGGGKAVLPVPFHPTMKHDEYVKGTSLLCSSAKPPGIFLCVTGPLHAALAPLDGHRLAIAVLPKSALSTLTVPGVLRDQFSLSAGSYHRWDWQKFARLAKLSAPAVAGQMAVGLQGAGLVYTSGTVLWSAQGVDPWSVVHCDTHML